jgi:hypothetical protein
MENTKERQNMATDYTMEDKKWNANKSRITAWLEVNASSLPESREDFINYLLSEGDSNPSMRKNWWSSICNAFRDVEDSPIQQGPRSTLPDDVDALIKSEKTALRGEIEAIYASMPRFVHYTMKHGKSGGGPFTTADEMAEYFVEKAARLLTNAYSAHTNDKNGKSFYWDGESQTEEDNPDDRMPAYTFVPKVVVEAATTGDSEE